MTVASLARRYFPILTWGAEYSRQTLVNDLIVAVIVTVMLIPQSLAYALLAGLPVQVGLFASMAPLLLYAIFGTSRTLAVGPVAIVSLMTAAAVAPLATQGSPEYLGAAIALALVSGLLLLAMGLLRLGFLANFLSHPVVSGFITASGLQIAASQFAPVLGIHAEGETFLELVVPLARNLPHTNPYTAVIGLGSLGFLFWARGGLKPLLSRLGFSERTAGTLAKIGPAVALVATTLAVWGFGLAARNVSIVGDRPEGLATDHGAAAGPGALGVGPRPRAADFRHRLRGIHLGRPDTRRQAAPARGSRPGADRARRCKRRRGPLRWVPGHRRPGALGGELRGRRRDAGGRGPHGGGDRTRHAVPDAAALLPAEGHARRHDHRRGALTRGSRRPQAHPSPISKADFAAMVATILVTLVEGVELGLVVGVGLSIFLHLYQTSKPHVAVVGQLPGTMNFRNVTRHAVVTTPEILSLRVDASLYFPNARFVEEYINRSVAAGPAVRHVILECAAVNTIDASALESLEAINQRLKDGGITLHLSEVKGPVMDRLKRSHFLEGLTGGVHLTQFDAVSSINPDLARRTLDAPRGDFQESTGGGGPASRIGDLEISQ